MRNWNKKTIAFISSIEKAFNSWDKCNNIYASFSYIRWNTAKDDLSKWDILFNGWQLNSVLRCSILPKAIYRFNSLNQVNRTVSFGQNLSWLEKHANLKAEWWENRIKQESLYHLTVSYWHKKKTHRSRKQSSETDMHTWLINFWQKNQGN